jgi:nitrogenase molybdenum-iron protein NifN
MTSPAAEAAYTPTTNPCTVCTPFGACLAFRGIRGAVPYLHGSQGCSTYIRRYLIGHFREPMDIASSNFSESATIFGGGQSLQAGLANVVRQYEPELIGIATTCLAETIGDDLPMLVQDFRREWTGNGPLPELICASTASYQGSHADGFQRAIRATVQTLAQPGPTGDRINVLTGIVSPADLRYLRELLDDFGAPYTLLPDYADTLDGPAWDTYHRIPAGGTGLEDIRAMGRAKATVELLSPSSREQSAGAFLADCSGVPCHELGMPIGVQATDRLVDVLEKLTGRSLPAQHAAERGRLLDAYVDGHKYIFEKRAIVFGEEDFAVGLTGMLAEIGVMPVLVASGEKTGRLGDRVTAAAGTFADRVTVMEGTDFHEMDAAADAADADLVVGNSNGAKLARRLGVPLIRVGLPIHDRIGGQRMGHLGYRGAQQLFDRIANAMIRVKQESSDIGYTHM